MLDFKADIVVGLMKSSVALGVARQKPFLADHHNQYFCFINRFLDSVFEVNPGINACNVNENVLLAKLRSETLQYTTRMARRIFSAIADKYFAHVLSFHARCKAP